MQEKIKALAVAFNSKFRYINDVSFINNCYFHSYVNTIYLSELEIKYTTDSKTSVTYLVILLEKDVNGNLTTKLYDKRDDFNFLSSTFLTYVAIYLHCDIDNVDYVNRILRCRHDVV